MINSENRISICVLQLCLEMCATKCNVRGHEMCRMLKTNSEHRIRIGRFLVHKPRTPYDSNHNTSFFSTANAFAVDPWMPNITYTSNER